MTQVMTVAAPGALAVTVAEAASLLRLSRSQMYALIQRGEIRSIKIGNSRRIPIVVLEEYVRNQLSAAGEGDGGGGGR